MHMGQTIAEEIWEEGRAKGLSEGRSEGRSEGLEALRRLVRQLLVNRFGTLPEAVLRRLEATADLDRLTAAALQVAHLTAPDDVQL
jgi:predicted transposase YdaD